MRQTPPVYLDHAATTPMRRSHRAMAAALARSATLLAAHRRPPRRRLEEARESGRPTGGTPSEVIITAGGTDSDNLAVKGIYWARRGADRADGASSPPPWNTTPCWTPWNGWPSTKAPRSRCCPPRPTVPVLPAALREVLSAYDDVALVSVMWANNEVGFNHADSRHGLCRSRIRCSDAQRRRQAIGQVPVDFAASGLSAMSITATSSADPSERVRCCCAATPPARPCCTVGTGARRAVGHRRRRRGGGDGDRRRHLGRVAGAVLGAVAGTARRADRRGPAFHRRRPAQRARGAATARQHPLHFPGL